MRLHEKVVRSRAPLRVSLAGGGTDVPPYPETYGGAVVSATINMFARCTVQGLEGDEIIVRSNDLNQVASFASQSVPTFDGNLDLVKAIFRRLDVTAPVGMSVSLDSDAPPGSGLGSSSAMVVAVIAALSRFYGLELTPREIANVACVVEREDLGISGGLQDQYAASFGGFNYIEFSNHVEIMPLRLSAAMRLELESHMVLGFSGATRLSGSILSRQIGNVVSSREDTMRGLQRLKTLATQLRRALHLEDLEEVAALVDEGWRAKRELAEGITSSALDGVHLAAMNSVALGGKLLGAGGGGYFLFFVPPSRFGEVSNGLAAAGITARRGVELCEAGVLSWEVPRVRIDLPRPFARVRS